MNRLLVRSVKFFIANHHSIVLEHLLVFQQSARFYRVDSRTLVSILARRLAANVSFFKKHNDEFRSIVAHHDLNEALGQKFVGSSESRSKKTATTALTNILIRKSSDSEYKKSKCSSPTKPAISGRRIRNQTASIDSATWAT